MSDALYAFSYLYTILNCLFKQNDRNLQVSYRMYRYIDRYITILLVNQELVVLLVHNNSVV